MIDTKQMAKYIFEEYANCYSEVDIEELAKHLDGIKAEAVKEFAERFERYLLSQLTSAPLDKKEWINFCLDELDNLKKEMVGADGD